MSSIRSRLAVGYAVTLLLTLGGFCAAVYYELRKPSISGLDAQLAVSGLAVQYLSESHRVLGRLCRPADRAARSRRALRPGSSDCATPAGGRYPEHPLHLDCSRRCHSWTSGPECPLRRRPP
jgi:hypothetical protein